jgi:hypothetical protein
VFSFIRALIGGASYASNPVKTGVKYLQQEIAKFEHKPSSYSEQLLVQLSEYAHKFSKQMYELSPSEKQVTYFLQHLEYVAITLAQAASGERPEVPEPLHNILSSHGISSRAA